VRTTDDVFREVSEAMASSGDSKSAAQRLANFVEFTTRIEQRQSSIAIPSEALRRKNTYGDDGRKTIFGLRSNGRSSAVIVANITPPELPDKPFPDRMACGICPREG
jgi:hypothetical protein